MDSSLYVAVHQVLFLLSGLLQTLGAQWLYYQGATTGASYLTALANYVGMAGVGLLLPFMVKNNSQLSYQMVEMADPDATLKENLSGIDAEAITATSRLQVEKRHDDHKISGQSGANSTTAELSETIVKSPIKAVFEKPIHRPEGPIVHKHIFRLALLDLCANFLVTVGFFYVGSGMYQVIYSSVVIWCAIMNFLLMGRSLTMLQWGAIVGTSCGLAISALGRGGDDTTSAATLLVGILLTLGGTLFYSCVYVYADFILSNSNPPPLPTRVCFTMGLYCTSMSAIWVLFYTLPHWDELIHIKAGVASSSIWLGYLTIVLASTCHAWNYYELIDRTGSVAVGVLQGLRAILVFVISHYWFCRSDSAQCFTVWKGWEVQDDSTGGIP
ncbi:hypothetical protein BZG36_01843 [Bifiguratus adelaidae]|uniref:EamA domain-containing protein n=1 Tax=Bifiguratus adelaidae TaxID=1938954 RepID=A0A261Y2G6_9FUNG|nr:hypothetical protein BZG36_01843 [Bifiguratus adelaidae]